MTTLSNGWAAPDAPRINVGDRFTMMDWHAQGRIGRWLVKHKFYWLAKKLGLYYMKRSEYVATSRISTENG
ncbi:MAG: hypothetical protein M3O09_04520 [Acidobacteriota bacterium]|nr:hypothetical protein [Acidobacteriota bacterium]